MGCATLNYMNITSSCHMRRAIGSLDVHFFLSIRTQFSFDHPSSTKRGHDGPRVPKEPPSSAQEIPEGLRRHQQNPGAPRWHENKCSKTHLIICSFEHICLTDATWGHGRPNRATSSSNHNGIHPNALPAISNHQENTMKFVQKVSC